MPGASADTVVGLTKTMLARRRGARSRIAVSVVHAAAFGLVVGWEPATVWLALYLAIQAAEVLLFDPDQDAAWRHPPVVGWGVLAMNALVYGSLALFAVSRAGVVGLVLAGPFFASAVLNALVTTQRSSGAFIACITPLLGYLALSVWTAFGLSGSWSFAAALALILGLMVFSSTVTWRAVAASQAVVRAARAEAERRRAQAEALTDAKSAFVAMVSHELRTPISAILAGAEAVGRDPARAAEHAALIGQAGRMMRALLNDLLDLSKMEAGRMRIEDVAFDLPGLIRDAVAFWSSEAAGKGLALTVEGLENLPDQASGDPTRLSQILNNLLSNAIKFTEAGAVTLSLGGTAGPGGFQLRLAVCDTGPGLTADRLARLFTPFEQGGAATARTHGGTGLGLAISRELARLMGGDLTCLSAPGEGSTFTLQVNLGAAAPAPGRSPPPEAGVRVLVVDDHEVNRRALDLMLEPLGVTVVLAESGAEALDRAAIQPFDVILMDVHMPELDGRETTRRLRARAGPNARTPVIACTGSDEPAEIERCRQAGMTGHIAKPIDAASLHRALAEALEAAARESAAA
ncbi:ATP-binding protein [Phenylobacterium terrae]|uniref:histidine kinase n=1 Tax=Phenylobacterium terrae TaxID=2665495 RepID=A0ABW4N013_9CAUL